MKIIAIDPSTLDVGWAIVEGLVHDENGWDDTNATWRWGHWKIGSNSLVQKWREIVEWMIMEGFDIDPNEDWIVIEWPAYYDGERGHAAAKRGSTINLASVCGYIAGFFRFANWRQVHLLTATEWKGNVSKETTRMRFFKHMGIKQLYTINHNAVDAVMLLLTFCKRKNITSKIISKIMEPIPHLEPED